MRSLSPRIYTRNYYLKASGNPFEFLRFVSKNKARKIEYFDSIIKNYEKLKVLDIGCGTGALDIYLAKKGANVVAIDYSKDAISLAKTNLAKETMDVKKKIKFLNIDIKKTNFKNNFFDLVIAIDVFEHLYKEELEQIMKIISKSLRKDGLLLVHTEANKIYLDFTHKYYVYPMASLLIWLNKVFTKKHYKNLSKNPRNKYHLEQHVNEPTLFYLKRLFERYRFEGEIKSLVSMIKPILSWKDIVYNLIVLLYPFCKIWPFYYLFAYDYLCLMKNRKR